MEGESFSYALGSRLNRKVDGEPESSRMGEFEQKLDGPSWGWMKTMFGSDKG